VWIDLSLKSQAKALGKHWKFSSVTVTSGRNVAFFLLVVTALWRKKLILYLRSVKDDKIIHVHAQKRWLNKDHCHFEEKKKSWAQNAILFEFWRIAFCLFFYCESILLSTNKDQSQSSLSRVFGTFYVSNVSTKSQELGESKFMRISKAFNRN